MNGNIVIVGDFNIDWLNINGSERKQFCNILETFGSHHLLDYSITRKDCNIKSDFTISNLISDHRALHASLQCIRLQPVRKQIAVRAIWLINDDAIVKDLDEFSNNGMLVWIQWLKCMNGFYLNCWPNMLH